MHYLYYPALLVLLLFGARVCKKGEWNDEVLSFAHTKAFLGFCAVIILFHHVSQRTCASWIPKTVIRHGYEPFLCAGYLCVGAFFFCSGFGMYTASHKPGFFDRFFTRRIMPLLTPTIIMWLVFFGIEKVKKMKMAAPVWLNTYNYIWYVPAMIYMYLFFYLAFKVIRKEWIGLLVLLAATVLHFVLCIFFSPGTWWYNTPFLFLLGVLFAKHKTRMFCILKKGYPVWLILSVPIALATHYIGNYYSIVLELIHRPYVEKEYVLVQTTGQVIAAAFFVLSALLIGMKLRIGNKALQFLGGITLEYYLVHPLFVHLFGFAFIQDGAKPLYYIKDLFLYALVVMVLTLPFAYALHRLTQLLWKRPVPAAVPAAEEAQGTDTIEPQASAVEGSDADV